MFSSNTGSQKFNFPNSHCPVSTTVKFLSVVWYEDMIIIRCGKRKRLHILRYSSILLEEQSETNESACIVCPQQHFETSVS
jgi:hypothetical protein